MRQAAQKSQGAPPGDKAEQTLDELMEFVARALELMSRRLRGDYTIDEFGFDPEFCDEIFATTLRPLYRSWFRVETSGIQHIPSQGAGLIVGNHAGAVPMDAMMTALAVHDDHPSGRYLRMLGADLMFKFPVISDVARKTGVTLANTADAQRLLSGGHLVGVWPEGFKGIGKPYSQRYRLQRFGRGGFVSTALRTGAPIIPCSIVGAEETYPIIGNLGTLARILGVPYVPVTPLFPLLGPLGLVPLPSKWLIRFGEPIPTRPYGPEGADDPMLVFELTDQVRETIQRTLYELLEERGSAFGDS
ncbi:MAG: hypothetical protein CSA58_12190 [Micrococcales bacterium]|nr:MAG: hypothetical protein CSB46_04750 [Micrococcales bacterium]PIE25927.1 MAG: hypothetical protein CSA58_12190 [Micrococcales bacterium]